MTEEKFPPPIQEVWEFGPCGNCLPCDHYHFYDDDGNELLNGKRFFYQKDAIEALVKAIASGEIPLEQCNDLEEQIIQSILEYEWIEPKGALTTYY